MRPLILAVVLALVGAACEEPAATEPFARGRQLFGRLGCARCHVIDAQGGRLGPDLSRIGTIAVARKPEATPSARGVADAYIRESILDPGAYIVPGYNDVMPRGLARNLSQSDLDALVLFLREHR